MKQYPSIPGQINKSEDFYCFDKLDGSNIRAEWSKKNGFYKFGTRRRLLDETDFQFPDAPSLVMENFSEDLIKIAKKNRIDRAVFFFEYYGQNSFAGYHFPDDPKRVSLIDVSIYKRGLLPPKEFLDLFGHLDIARLLYHGKVNEQLIQAVRNRELEGMTHEGIVCKAFNRKKPGLPTMFKVKSLDWYQELKKMCGDNEALYEQLK